MIEGLTSEAMSKAFMGLAHERYPTAKKALDMAKKLLKGKKTLGPASDVKGMIIVLSQMRDAVRQVSLHKIYKSVQHRDDIFAAIIEALEDLEDQWEELQMELEEEQEEWDDSELDAEAETDTEER